FCPGPVCLSLVDLDLVGLGYVRSFGFLDRRLEAVEELVGHLARETVDDAAAELGELAAHMRIDGIAELGPIPGIGQRHIGAALGEARSAALARTADAVGLPLNDIGQGDRALEGGTDRADLLHDDRLEAAALGAGHFLAT